MSTEATEKTLQADLIQFTGTSGYYRWSALYPNMVLTDGARYLAEKAGAYWLMDAIASHIVYGGNRKRMREEGFVVAKMKVNGRSARLTLDDGNGNVLARQRIGYTDFPKPGIELYAEYGDGRWVILLPSEH
ncbi:MAG: hypothetical protein M0Z61_04840 [Nitrospiraceae bacterium]|nr:hypothetical protein [Nitrospiraceae bacterium]